MNKLALTALMAFGLTQAGGCIITTDDDPDPTTGGILDVTWPVEACNSTTATVYTMNSDTQEMFMDTYACSDGGTVFTTNPIRLDLGNYNVWVEIQNDTMTRSHARSSSEAVSFTADGQAVTIDTIPAPTEQGFFEVEWTLSDEGSGAALTCAQAGASGARTIATLANTTEGIANIFTCDDGVGVSVAMDPGLYTVVVEILDAVDASLATSESFEETVIGNYFIHLGIFDFTFAP